MAMAIIPFALSWFLKEVPLRTSNRSAELASEQAATGSAPAEELVEPLV